MSTINTYNESLLTAAVVRGDRQAYAVLYRQYLDIVTRYIYLFTRSEAESDEIVQDVFVRIWEQREKLASVSSFKGYLMRACRNRVLDHVRHQRVRMMAFDELQYRASAEMPATPEEVWDYKEIYSKVQAQISALPAQCQHVFRLSVEKGMSLDEIAEQLHISKSGVKNNLYKAQRLVRQCLEDKDRVAFTMLFIVPVMLFQ